MCLQSENVVSGVGNTCERTALARMKNVLDSRQRLAIMQTMPLRLMQTTQEKMTSAAIDRLEVIKMSYFTDIFRQLIPVRTEAIVGMSAGVVGMTMTFLFGGWNNALQALAMLMLIDYMTGVMGAFIAPDDKLSSKRGFRGIVKKMVLVLLVSTAHFVDVAVAQNVFCPLVTYVLIGNEGLSIIENCSHCGVPVPEALRVKLEQLAHEKEEAGRHSRR